MSRVGEEKKQKRRSRFKKAIEVLDKAFKNLENKVDGGDPLRDQELRFLDHYPDTRQRYEALIMESLKEIRGIPEGQLKEFLDKYEAMNNIGKHEDIIEATGYYRCEGLCNELHKKGEDCMYLLYQEMSKSSKESKELEEGINVEDGDNNNEEH